MNGDGSSDKVYPLEPEEMSWTEKVDGEFERRYRDVLRPAIKETPRPIPIDVSAEDIANSVRNIISNSPVTNAIKRSSRLPGDVIPLWTIVRIGPSWYGIPTSAQKAMKDFDKKKRIKPFTFTLRPLPDIDFLANPDRLGKTSIRATGGETRMKALGVAAARPAAGVATTVAGTTKRATAARTTKKATAARTTKRAARTTGRAATTRTRARTKTSR